MSWFFASGGQSIGAFRISPSSEYSGLISFKMDWFDLLAVQGTLKLHFLLSFVTLGSHCTSLSLISSSAKWNDNCRPSVGLV